MANYLFLRSKEDDVIEAYFKEPDNIRHLVILLQSLDAVAFFAEVLHNYVNKNESLRNYIYGDDRLRQVGLEESTEKFGILVRELIGTLELGNLADLAKANYIAYTEAKRLKPRVGLWRLLKEFKNPDVQLTMGFVILLLKEISKLIEGNGSFKKTQNKA